MTAAPRTTPPKPAALAILYMSALMLIGPFLHLQYLHVSHHWRLAPKGVYGDEAMVVSAHFLASEVGRNVLRDGGNAFDAAVAVNFALAVVYQQAGNIGGGGFMVYRMADGATGTLDFRERSPFKASRAMYLDEDGEVIKGMSLKGHFAVGVPGSVAGMAALQIWGPGLPNLPVPAVGWPLFMLLGILYFAMAYLILGSLFLGIGAMASTVREVQTLSMPVTMLQMFVFGFAFYTVSKIGQPIEIVACIVPFTSPFAMLARAAQVPEIWPHLVALFGQGLFALLVVRISAMMFRRTVMKSGGSGGGLKALFGRRKTA